MRSSSYHRWLAWAAAAGLVLAACGGSYRKELHDGFPPGPAILVDGDEERNLRAALASYHVPPAGIDCMVVAVRADGRFTVGPGSTAVTGGRPTVAFTGEELNAYARGCGVDITALWYTSD